MIHYTELNTDFIISRFPELRQQVTDETRGFDEFLPHAVFGGVFNRLTADLLKQDGYRNDALLLRIFAMYEELSANGDFETQNLVQVTLLEYLWDEKTTYQRATELMGAHTRESWNEITYLSVPSE